MIIFFIFVIFINIIFNYDNLMNSIYNSLFIWFYNIYPSIFIFYNISYYLYNNIYFNRFSLLFKYIIKFDSNRSYSIFFINFFLGNPGTTNLIYEAYESNEISEYDFNKLNDFTFCMNPLFILPYLGYIYFIIYIISYFIYIFIFSRIFKYKNKDNKFCNSNINKYSIKSFFNSINNSIMILLNVAGLVTFFNILKEIIIFSTDKFNITYFNYLLSFLEVASGLRYLSSFNNIYSYVLLISFQGLCILIQSFSVISKKNISFKRYIFVHIINSILVTLIFYILTTLFHI